MGKVKIKGEALYQKMRLERITWNTSTVGNGGVSALIAGDVIHVYYFKG